MNWSGAEEQSRGNGTLERTNISIHCTVHAEATFQLFVNEKRIQVNRTAGDSVGEIINEPRIEIAFTRTVVPISKSNPLRFRKSIHCRVLGYLKTFRSFR